MPDYPGYRYHLTKPPLVVMTHDEDEAATADGYRYEAYSAEELAHAAPPVHAGPSLEEKDQEIARLRAALASASQSSAPHNPEGLQGMGSSESSKARR